MSVDNKEGKNGDSFKIVILGELDHTTIAAKILAVSLANGISIKIGTHFCVR